MGFTAHVCTVEVKLSVEAYWKNSEAPLLKQGHFSFPKSTLPLSLFIVLKPARPIEKIPHEYCTAMLIVPPPGLVYHPILKNTVNNTS